MGAHWRIVSSCITHGHDIVTKCLARNEDARTLVDRLALQRFSYSLQLIKYDLKSLHSGLIRSQCASGTYCIPHLLSYRCWFVECVRLANALWYWHPIWRSVAVAIELHFCTPLTLRTHQVQARHCLAIGHSFSQVELAHSVGDGGCHMEECIVGCCIACVECGCDRDDMYTKIVISDISQLWVTRGD